MKALLFPTCALVVFLLAGCGDQQTVDSDSFGHHLQHPDQVLLDRAIRSLENNRYAEANALLQTLIETFPDSPLTPGVKSTMENFLREHGCAPIIMAGCGGMTFFPNMDSPEEWPKPLEDDLSPEETLARCMRYKD